LVCAGPISYRPPISCSQDEDRARKCEKDARHQAHHRDDQCQRPPGRASPRGSSQGLARTSSWRSGAGRNSMADSVVDVADVAERDRQGRRGGYYDTQTDARHGWQQMDRRALGGLVGGLVAYRKVVAGGKAGAEKNSPKPGDEYRAIGKKAEGGRSSLRSEQQGIPSATRRDGGIPICGRGAARRSRTTARLSSSTARRRSSQVRRAVVEKRR